MDEEIVLAMCGVAFAFALGPAAALVRRLPGAAGYFLRAKAGVAFGSRALVVGSVALAAVLAPTIAAAQSDSVTVIASRQYQAGAVQRFLLGEDYRDLWTAPLTVPVLDLDTFAGGLTPVRTGGNVQTMALRFEGADGREYNFRSVEKELTPAVPPYARETVLDWLRQDQTSAQHPVAPIVATPLLDAVGVLNPGPRLVVLPDDPALGEFREQYAGMLGTIEVHADENRENPAAGFANAIRVAGTDRLLEHLEEDAATNRVDSRALLAARLMDVFLGDWDRHEGQWRWARYSRNGIDWWVPVPEDRDYAFVDYDGLLLAVARSAGFPRLVRFEETYPDLLAMMANSLELNRRLLADLPGGVWDSVAVRLQTQLTDEVIARAARTMPPAYYRLQGAEMERILRARRDRLGSMARDYYALLAKAPEIHGSDLDDRAEVARDMDGTVAVRLFAPGSEGADTIPYYTRTFLPDETEEVRILLHGGDDVAEVTGADGPIVVRVVGGDDNDRLVDRSRGPTTFYDADGENEIVRGPRTTVNRRPYASLEEEDGLVNKERRDWGSDRTLFSPAVGWHPHAGPLIGAGPTWTEFGFRHDPFESRHALRVVYAPAEVDRFGLEYRMTRHQASSSRRLEVLARASSIEATRFHGFGNSTPDLPEHRALVWGHELGLGIESVFPFAREVAFRAGPHLRYTERDVPPAIPASEAPENIGGGLAQAGFGGAVEIDTRDDAIFPRQGFHVAAESEGAVSLDDGSAFGKVGGRASLFLPLGGPATPVVVLRAGGEQALGEYPYFAAAFLGGSRSLRGYPYQRFAGDGALYGTAEARVPIMPATLVVHGRLGVSAFADAGRVFFDGRSPGTWHLGVGGGIWFASPLAAVSLNYARGDRSRVYLQFGLPQ